MYNIIERETIKIENMIYEIRGKQVMLDSDLAKLYECKNGTKDINKAVKRNTDRFPSDFYFELTAEETHDLRFQIGTANKMTRSLPHVFTEQGVAMLSSLLRTEVSAQASINIMRAFVVMKKYISNNLIEQKYINKLVLEDHENLKLLQESFNKLQEKEKINSIFYEGQIYDAYSLMIDIFNKSKNEIIIIDNYVDKNILDVISKINKNIIIYTNKYNNEDYNRYNKQYKNIKLKITDKFHDRFIIIDKKTLYHSGTKCFAINKIEDNNILNELLKKL